MRLKKKNKFINGTRGVISIFLSICMLSALSVNCVLIEAVRYQGALQMLEEIVDSAGFSTLANFDSYLEERFGLMALSQKQDSQEVFSEYMNDNISAIGKSVTLDEDVEAEGAYPLSSTAVLEQQIYEYSEIIGPAQTLFDVGDIGELIKLLEKQLPEKLQTLSDEAKAAGDAASLAKELTGLVETITKVCDQYEAYDKAYKDYKKKYLTFEAKLLEWIEEITPSDEDEKKEVSSTLVSEEKKARDEYKKAAAELASQTKTFGSSVADLQNVVNTLSEKIETIDSNIDKEVDKNSTKTSTESATTYLIQEISQLSRLIKETFGENYSAKVSAAQTELANQQEELRRFNPKESLNETITKEIIRESFGPHPSIVGEDFIAELIVIANAISIGSDLELKNEMTTLVDFAEMIEAIMEMDVLYDLALNAEVSMSNMYVAVPANASAESLSTSFQELLSAIYKLSDVANTIASSSNDKNLLDKTIAAVKGAFAKLFKLADAMWSFFQAVANYLLAIVQFAVEVVARLGSILGSGLGEFYNDILLTTYCTYNFPCRTNYASGKTLTGYSYSKIFQMAGGNSDRISVLGGTFANLAKRDLAQDNDMFYGAELEYLLAGTSSEVDNQIAVFSYMYILRILFDLGPILQDAELSAICETLNAATYGIGGTVVRVLAIAAEPYLDMLILVNGGSEVFLKNQIYLSPTGITTFIKDLSNALDLSKQGQENLKAELEYKANGQIDKLKDSMDKLSKKANLPKKEPVGNEGLKEDKGKTWFKMDYKEHAILLLMCANDPNDVVARIQNLIQTEGAKNYRTSFDFELDKTYTYIKSTVSGVLNPMLPAEKLTENGLFSFKNTQYTGY